MSPELWYEDLTPGQRYITSGRTMTETDLIFFSMLSGDWNPIHVDEKFCSGTVFGTRVVHGVLGIAIITGLMDRAGWFSTSAIAMLGIDNWKFHAPMMVGQTLHAEMVIGETRRTRDGRRGIVQRKFLLVTHDGDVLQSGSIPMLIACRDVEMNSP